MSGRIRSIKPDVLEDELSLKLSDAAWRLWVSSWVLADDAGRFRAGSQFLAGRVFGDTGDLARVEVAFVELHAHFIRRYNVDGQVYGQIKPSSWARHQRIEKPSESRLPAPSPTLWGNRSGHESFPKVAQDGSIREGIIFPGSAREENIPACARPLGQEGTGMDRTGGEDFTHRSSSLSGSAQSVQNVLLYWQRQRYHLGAKPYLTAKRRDLVAKRLADGFTVLQLQQAIRGASFDDWYMGKLTASPGFKGIEHLLKDVERVEKFRDLALQYHWTERSVALEVAKLAAAAAGLPVDASDLPPTSTGASTTPLGGPEARQTPAPALPTPADTPTVAPASPMPGNAPAPFDPDAPDPEWEKQLANLREIQARIGTGGITLPPDGKPS